MTDDYIPNPANYTMKGNKPTPQQMAQEAPDPSRLEELSKDELIALIKRVSGAIWGIGLMTPEEIAAAMKLKLANGGLTQADMFKALPLMREWFDRQMGKAAQSVAVTVKDEGIGKLRDDRLLVLERELARMTGQDAIVIAPLPEKLGDDTIS